ncbi:YugN family protein [Cohnella caldifontis]|uniref:YugN family protein n=1 Tax=Cohnella caldifontis TaxID=3027471 RepID=UPI0023EB03B9|nr:YugN family protein [Cohnella sp. YIM B05605]
MYPIDSKLTSQVQEFVPFRSAAAEKGFVLGGNWDYDHGSFDCALDGVDKVWLRLPFEVTHGNLDSESEENDAKIRFGQPYVLKHMYNEGLNPEAEAKPLGAMFDQFSEPANPDAEVETRWIEEARRKLNEIEAIFPA